MPVSARISLLSLFALLAFSQTGCNLIPQQQYRQSQLRSRQLYDQNKALASQNSQASQMAQSLATEKLRLSQQNSSMRGELDIANRRLQNLSAERTNLQQRYTSLLQNKSPLSDATTRRFEDLARKYPDFEFDPQTGVSKFHSDILFSSGSAQLKQQASPLLRDFGQIMNEGDAQRLNILVVGHTDDKPISRVSTRSKHPTNWHLSTNRANSVVVALSRSGIKPNRMGVAGYSMYQPLNPNKNDKARQQNRRVEIFVLAPDAIVAGWDPGTSRK